VDPPRISRYRPDDDHEARERGRKERGGMAPLPPSLLLAGHPACSSSSGEGEIGAAGRLG